MKKLLLVLFLVSNFAFASGKISFTPAYNLRNEMFSPKIGFAIYEPIIGGIAYNGWVGMGLNPRDNGEEVFWAASKHDMEKWFGNVGVAVGFTFVHSSHPGDVNFNDSDVHLKLTYQLW